MRTLLITTLLIAQAYGTEIRLDQPGFSMAKVRVMDQGNTYLCYAYTATQLVDAFIGSKTQSSAFKVGVNVGKDEGREYDDTFNRGGYVCDAVASINKHGLCKHKDINVDRLVAGNLSLDGLSSLIGCKDKVRVQVGCKETPRKGLTNEGSLDLLKMVDGSLSKGKKSQPVGVKYCANFLVMGKSIKALNNGKWLPNCKVHYSMIIGKRDNEYLIRDSYGLNCGNNVHHDFKCKAGNIWVSTEDLINNLLTVVTLSNIQKH